MKPVKEKYKRKERSIKYCAQRRFYKRIDRDDPGLEIKIPKDQFYDMPAFDDSVFNFEQTLRLNSAWDIKNPLNSSRNNINHLQRLIHFLKNINCFDLYRLRY